MLGYLAVFASGLLFALGLGISGMTLPQKVIGFLDFAGPDWDPSLALVMASSAGVYMIFYPLVQRLSHPLFDTRFHVPTRHDIDQPLIVGALIFGIGWGLVGFCPGPAVTALVSGQTPVFIFFVAMALGMFAEGSLDVASRIRTEENQAVDG